MCPKPWLSQTQWFQALSRSVCKCIQTYDACKELLSFLELILLNQTVWQLLIKRNKCSTIVEKTKLMIIQHKRQQLTLHVNFCCFLTDITNFILVCIKKRALGLGFNLHLLPDSFQNDTGRYTSLYCFHHPLCCTIMVSKYMWKLLGLYKTGIIFELINFVEKQKHILRTVAFNRNSETSLTLSHKSFSGVF